MRIKEYNFICMCTFKHGVFVNENLLGKTIPIKIQDKYEGDILLPILKPGDNMFELVAPYIDRMIYQEVCGKVSKNMIQDRTTLHPIIHSVFLGINLKEEVSKSHQIIQIIKEIELYASKFLKCVSLIHPSAIKWSYAREDGYVEPINFYHTKQKTDQKWTGHVNVNVDSSDGANELSHNDFFVIYKGLNKDITLQYELLSDIYRCFERNEYREVILNCTTIIEITLKEQIEIYLDKLGTADDIKKYILKSTDGFNKILEAMKKFGIFTDNCGAIKQGTVDVRNRVIHGRHIPTTEEAEQAVEDAKLIMKQYNVQLFIN